MQLKLIFDQVTYIATIFQLSMVWLWGLPSGDIIISFPIQLQKLFSQPLANLHRFTTDKLTGRCAQLFLGHQNTARLTFNCHHAILAAQEG